MTEPPTKKQKSPNDKSKAYQYKSKKRHLLEIGHKGFLATCNYHEKDCVRECYNILSHYADELYGKEPRPNAKKEEEVEKKSSEGEGEDKETDISDDLQREIDAVNAEAEAGRSRRFQAVDTGTKNCVFIKTNVENPVELGEKLIKDIAEKKIQRSRHLLRLTPIEVVCRATVEEITKTGKALIENYFNGEEGRTFQVVYNKRYNNDLNRDEIIKILADMVLDKNEKHKVDLKNGEMSIIVEILKGKCCMSVVQGYMKYKKFNLAELVGLKPVVKVKKMKSQAAEKDGEKDETDENSEVGEEADAPEEVDMADGADKVEEADDTEKDKPEPEKDADTKPAGSEVGAKRKTTSEEDQASAPKKPVPFPDIPIGNKLKELLERKKPSDDEPTAKKFKDDDPENKPPSGTPEKSANE